jgi:hypothetical protein
MRFAVWRRGGGQPLHMVSMLLILLYLEPLAAQQAQLGDPFRINSP